MNETGFGKKVLGMLQNNTVPIMFVLICIGKETVCEDLPDKERLRDLCAAGKQEDHGEICGGMRSGMVSEENWKHGGNGRVPPLMEI